MSSVAFSQRLSASITATAGQTDFEAGFPPPAQVGNAYVGIYIDRLRPPGLIPVTLEVGVDFSLVNIQTNAFTARLNAPAQAGDIVRVYGRGKESRQSVYAPGRLDSAALEGEFARQSMRLQEHSRDILQAAKVQFGDRPITYPRAAARAGKIAVFDGQGDVDTSRDLVAFDNDVSGVAVKHEQVAQDTADTRAYRDEAIAARNESADLLQGISQETLASIHQIVNQYDTASQNLTDREAGSLYSIDAAKTGTLDAVQAAKDDALDSVAADKQTAVNAAAEAVAALELIQPLPDRVTALENAGLAASWTLGLSINTAVAEVGSTVAVTLSRSTNQALTSASINNGVGAVALTVGTVGGYAGGNITANTTWTLTAQTTYGASKVATASLTFRSKRYWGVTTKAPGTAMTDADLLGLASAEFATSYSKSGMVFDCTGGRYPVYAWPAALGTPTEIFVGGFASSDFTIDTQDHVNASGATVSYKILRLNTLQNGNAIGVSI